MTPKDDIVDRINYVLVGVSPGPWEAWAGVRGMWAVEGPVETSNTTFPYIEADARLIAGARPMLTEAAETIVWLRSRVAELERTIETGWILKPVDRSKMVYHLDSEPDW